MFGAKYLYIMQTKYNNNNFHRNNLPNDKQISKTKVAFINNFADLLHKMSVQ